MSVPFVHYIPDYVTDKDSGSQSPGPLKRSTAGASHTSDRIMTEFLLGFFSLLHPHQMSPPVGVNARTTCWNWKHRYATISWHEWRKGNAFYKWGKKEISVKGFLCDIYWLVVFLQALSVLLFKRCMQIHCRLAETCSMGLQAWMLLNLKSKWLVMCGYWIWQEHGFKNSLFTFFQ